MKGKILFALMLLIVPMAIAVVDNEPSADGDWSMVITKPASEGRWTVVVGKYIPSEGEVIPVGERVKIYCRHDNRTRKISNGFTRISSNGLFGTSTTNNRCFVGDMVGSCIQIDDEFQCSEWVEVKNYVHNDETDNGSGDDELDNISFDIPKNGRSGIFRFNSLNLAETAIFGAPEFTPLTAGLLVLTTIGMLAILRKR